MRYFLSVAYDGRVFHGSQVQTGVPTVQGRLNEALSMLLRFPVTTFGASRTDEGVHARANFFHFDVGSPLPANFLYKLNAVLPPELAVREILQAISDDANARFDAVTRRYRYRLYTKKNPFLHGRAFYYPFQLNRHLLNDTAEMLLQYSDFESFSKRNTQSHTFICRIDEAYWELQGDEFCFVVVANRFLRGMVRGLVGTQLQVARGKMDLAGFRHVIESKDCTLADFSVPGHGLYLEEIQYPQDYFLRH